MIPKMSTFTLVISCLTTSNLPWFMDLKFQVLCNIALYSTGPCFHLESHPELSVVLLWLCLFILSGIISPLISSSLLGTYWPGDIFSILSFCLFILFMGFPRQEYWSSLPFPSPVDHILSSTFEEHLMTFVKHIWRILVFTSCTSIHTQ